MKSKETSFSLFSKRGREGELMNFEPKISRSILGWLGRKYSSCKWLKKLSFTISSSLFNLLYHKKTFEFIKSRYVSKGFDMVIFSHKQKDLMFIITWKNNNVCFKDIYCNEFVIKKSCTILSLYFLFYVISITQNKISAFFPFLFLFLFPSLLFFSFLHFLYL